MPGVEGVVADTVQCLVRQLGLVVLQDLVQVLIMPKGHLDLVQTAVGLVDPILGAVACMCRKRNRKRSSKVLFDSNEQHSSMP